MAVVGGYAVIFQASSPLSVTYNVLPGNHIRRNKECEYPFHGNDVRSSACKSVT